nr:unnamed protein product [Digitaria exilis]
MAGGSRARLLALVALCSLLARPQPSRAFLFSGGVRSRSTSVPQGGGDREEKVPMAVVVPADYAPRPAPLGPSPSTAPAPAPERGSDGGGGDEDGTPRMPSERRRGRSTGDHGAAGQAPAGATSADFISSSPAVPLPGGVADSATVLPMPTPGRQQQRRDDAGMGALQLQVRVVQLAVPLLMMVSFGALL